MEPQFGTWVASGSIPKVVANPGPSSAIVPNPSANQGATVTTGTKRRPRRVLRTCGAEADRDRPRLGPHLVAMS